MYQLGKRSDCTLVKGVPDHCTCQVARGAIAGIALHYGGGDSSLPEAAARRLLPLSNNNNNRSGHAVVRLVIEQNTLPWLARYAAVVQLPTSPPGRSLTHPPPPPGQVRRSGAATHLSPWPLPHPPTHVFHIPY